MGWGRSGLAGRREPTAAWVSTIQSNAVLAFNTAALRQHPSAALRAVVRVGSESVGLAVVNGGRTVLATDSDRGLVAPRPGRQGSASSAPRPRRPGALLWPGCCRPGNSRAS